LRFDNYPGHKKSQSRDLFQPDGRNG